MYLDTCKMATAERHIEECIFDMLPDETFLTILEHVMLSPRTREESYATCSNTPQEARKDMIDSEWTSDTGPNVKQVRLLASASYGMRVRIMGHGDTGIHDTKSYLFPIRLMMFRIEMKVSVATDRYFFNKTTDMMYGMIDSTEFGEFHSRIKLKEYLPNFVRTIWPLKLQGVPFGQFFTLNGGVPSKDFIQLSQSHLRVKVLDVPYKPLESSTPMAYREYKPAKSSTLLLESESESYRRMYRQTTPNWRAGCSDYVMYILQFQGEKFFQDTICPFAYILMPSEKLQTRRMREYVDRVFRCMKEKYNYDYVDMIEVFTQEGSHPSYVMVSKNVCRDRKCMLCNVKDNIECHCPMEQFCDSCMCMVHNRYQTSMDEEYNSDYYTDYDTDYSD